MENEKLNKILEFVKSKKYYIIAVVVVLIGADIFYSKHKTKEEEKKYAFVKPEILEAEK